HAEGFAKGLCESGLEEPKLWRPDGSLVRAGDRGAVRMGRPARNSSVGVSELVCGGVSGWESRGRDSLFRRRIRTLTELPSWEDSGAGFTGLGHAAERRDAFIYRQRFGEGSQRFGAEAGFVRRCLSGEYAARSTIEKCANRDVGAKRGMHGGCGPGRGCA